MNIETLINGNRQSRELVGVRLDITNIAEAEAAIRAGVHKFGQIDLLVNNAANFYAGYFEELFVDEIDGQLATSLFGPMKVIEAVLPVMRKQRASHIVTISSTVGMIDYTFCSAYWASEFVIEGWMESLQTEVEQFGIKTTIVNPGFFRTELWTEESTKYSEVEIEDYNEGRKQQLEFWKGANGQQGGDPAKLAQALLKVIEEEKPPLRFLAGGDAIGTAEQLIKSLREQIEAYRELSSSLAY